MKKSFPLSLVIFFFIISQATAKPGDDLFDDSYVHDIRINFYEPQFWDSLNYYYSLIYDFSGLPTGPKIYLRASINIDGQTLDTVGVRQKGFFSNWGALNDKKPLKVDINEFVKGQKYDGLKKFNLNNGFEDPSLMRDMLSLNLMRGAGIPAPRTAYARVFLNNTYWGLYILIEQVDKTFLKENFSNGDGNLYKSISATDLQWQGNNFVDYQDELELKTNETENDWSGLVHFLDVINNRPNPDSILSVFNAKDFLNVLSIDLLLLNWDSYYDHGRNFYIYHNPDDGKFHWIPWDYNLAWSGNDTDILFTTFGGIAHKPVISNLFAVDSFKTHYFNHYCENIRDNFSTERLFPLIDSTYNMIRQHYSFSTNEFFSISEFDQSRNADVMGGFGGIYRGLKPFIGTRVNEVQSELSNLSHVCPPATALQPLVADNNALMLYPNPAQEEVHLELKSGNQKNSYEVSIFDHLGRKVGYYPQFEQSITIPTDQLPNGMYTVTLTDGSRRSTKRLMVFR